MSPDEKCEALIVALEKVGLDGAVVQNSPVHAVNVWGPNALRTPDATVVIDGDGFTWGHQYEFNQPPTERAFTTVARAIAATLP